MNDLHNYRKELDFRNGAFWVHDPDQRFKELKRTFIYDSVGGGWKTTDIKKAVDLRSVANARAKIVFGRYYIIENKSVIEDFSWPSGLAPLPFQIPAAHFAITRNRSYLWLDPGLGKTPISVLINNHSPGRTLIVCPSFLKYHWKRTFMDWNTTNLVDSNIALIEAGEDVRDVHPSTPITIFPDSLTPNHKAVAALKTRKYDRAFIDEAHRYGSLETKRTQAIYGGFKSNIEKGRHFVRGLESSCSQVVSLSGTAMPNFRPMELYPVLWSQCPGEIDFKSHFDYGMKYCAGFHDGFGYDFSGASNIPDLQARIFGKYILRMKKEDHLKDLPPKTREIIHLEGKVSPFVTDFSKDLLSTMTGSEILEMQNGGAVDIGDIARLRREVGTALIEPSVELLIELLETTQEKIIVGAYHREVVEALSFRLKKYGVVKIIGGMKPREKDDIVKAFQTDPDVRVAVMNMEAGGVGTTMTAAHRVIVVEPDWRPGINVQFEDRTHRIGQLDNVLCQYLVLANTISEVIVKAILRKLEMEKKQNV